MDRKLRPCRGKARGFFASLGRFTARFAQVLKGLILGSKSRRHGRYTKPVEDLREMRRQPPDGHRPPRLMAGRDQSLQQIKARTVDLLQGLVAA